MLNRRRLIALFATPVLAGPALAQRGDRLHGLWRGRWSNSTGESGADTLMLSEDSRGYLQGLWTNEINVSGQRAGPDSAVLRGRTAKRAYEIDIVVEGNRMTLTYVARRLDSAGSYSGRSVLRLDR